MNTNELSDRLCEALINVCRWEKILGQVVADVFIAHYHAYKGWEVVFTNTATDSASPELIAVSLRQVRRNNATKIIEIGGNIFIVPRALVEGLD